MSNARRPNLLFVFADQMRGMDMRCAGNAVVRTDTMDRLAAEGLRLTHCYATTPVCGPNRATMLTGTRPTTHRVLGNDLAVPTDLPSLGKMARVHGYRTGYVGKWHLDGVPRTKFTPPGPRRLGFDDYWAVYNCAHSYFQTKYYRDEPELIEVKGYEPEVQTDLAIEFLESQPSDQPFCLTLSWGPPHDPYDQVPERYRAMYDPDTLPLRPNVQPEIDNPLIGGRECRRCIADYYAAITALDDQLARLLATLDRLGMADDTIVVFTSDHGDMLWSQGLLQKQLPYEESVSVPMLLRWPGRLQAGAVRDVLMGSVDLLPTFAGLMGLPVPEGVEGLDLSEALHGRAGALQPDALLIGNPLSCDQAETQGVSEWRGVRTHRYTYAEQTGRRPWLLFDNELDPYQLDNLVDRPDHAGLQATLRQTLDKALTEADDPFLEVEQMLAHLGISDAWREREASKAWSMTPGGKGF